MARSAHPITRTAARWSAVAGLVLLAVAATACGTTVPLAEQQRAAAGTADGLSGGSRRTTATGPSDALAATDEPAGGPTDTLGPGGGEGTGSLGTTPTGSGSDGAQTSGSTAAPPRTAGPATGRGFTASTVYLGYGTSDDSSAAVLGAFGVGGLEDPGDLGAQLNAAVKEVMGRGGLAGRKIVLVPHNYDLNEVLTNPDTAAQKACADMTQDHQIVAMIAPVVTNDVAKACFAKAGVPMIMAAGLENPKMFKANYAANPLYIGIGSMTGDRYFGAAVQSLAARRFFDPWNAATGQPGGGAPVKVGVLVIDNDAGSRTLAIYEAALAKLGMKVAATTRLSEDISTAIAQGSAAVLRYRSAGITHVLGITIPFANTAEQQNYRPRYYVNIAMQVVAQSAPVGQLNGAMAVGYTPAFDTDAKHDPGNPTPATDACLKVMRAGGQIPSNQQAKFSMEIVCDSVFFLKAAVDANGGDLTGPAIVRGFEAIGSSLQASSTWTSVFAKGEHASARAVRDMGFDASCRCFLFQSTTNRVAE